MRSPDRLHSNTGLGSPDLDGTLTTFPARAVRCLSFDCAQSRHWEKQALRLQERAHEESLATSKAGTTGPL